jgi:ABC-type branched-subunit amino acid transport system ATPase component
VKSVSGSVTFDAQPIEPNRVHRNVRLGIGFVPQSRNVFQSLTVEQCLKIAGLRAGNPHASSVFAFLPLLAERRHQRAGSLSGGEQQMLAVGMALMTRPKALLLDEPAAGLSAEEIRRLGALVVEIAKTGTGVLLVEHHADLIFDICDHVTVLNLGKKLAAGTPAEIRSHREVVNAYLGG